MLALHHTLLATCVLAATMFASPALAQESAARSCLKAKVWDGYKSKWAMRTMTSERLTPGGTHNYMVTFYPGKQYLIRGCGDDDFVDLDVLIYDSAGKVVARDDSESKEPELHFTTDKVATYYLVMHARQMSNGSPSGWSALAITHR